MGNKLKNKRITARRVATFLAALGVLVMSSGVALMATTTSANAAPAPDKKVVVCKYVSTPGGELDHIVVVSVNTLPDAFGGSFPFAWTDAHGGQGGSIAVRFAAQGEQAKDISTSECVSTPAPGAATASVTAVQATCTTAASYTTAGSHIESFTQSAAPAAGTSITVTAHAATNFLIDGAATKDFPLVFAAAPTNCGSTVSTPQTSSVSPPKNHVTKTKTPAVTPTVVHAGLAGTTTQDMRGEQGLALMFAGMIMLIAAGGLGLRLRGSRI